MPAERRHESIFLKRKQRRHRHHAALPHFSRMIIRNVLHCSGQHLSLSIPKVPAERATADVEENCFLGDVCRSNAQSWKGKDSNDNSIAPSNNADTFFVIE